ncbi:MAG: hypothetical protein NXI22_05750, partial [bacterium]|nr:hypothetical protein [bacterium]
MVASDIRWENRRQDNRTADNADQTEFSAMSYGRATLDSGTLDDRIAEALDDFETTDPIGTEEWSNTDLRIENAVGELGLELERRKRILGKAYPFELTKGQLVYSGSKSLAYELCLAISQSPGLSGGEFKKLPVAFERLMLDLVLRFLGEGSVGRRTGWPPEGDRPARFKSLVAELHNETNEWRWSPDHGFPDDPSSQQIKDAGLDFVAWKQVQDSRVGRLFVVGQCACGNDFETKLQDIDKGLVKLGQWIKPVCFATPVRAFCTPRHIPNDIYF